jgi:hypothetical protein
MQESRESYFEVIDKDQILVEICKKHSNVAKYHKLRTNRKRAIGVIYVQRRITISTKQRGQLKNEETWQRQIEQADTSMCMGGWSMKIVGIKSIYMLRQNKTKISSNNMKTKCQAHLIDKLFIQPVTVVSWGDFFVGSNFSIIYRS